MLLAVTSSSPRAVGRRIAQLRGGRNQMDFARLTGTTQTTLSRVERGERIPKVETLEKIARACSVDLSWILYGTGKGPPDAPLEDLAAEADLDTESPTVESTGLAEAFRARLRTCARAAGGAASLADAADLSRRSVGEYLSGVRDPSPPTLAAIARAAGVRLEWLADGTEPMKTNGASVVADAVRVPVYSAKPRGGAGAADPDWIEDAITVDPAELRAMGVSPKSTAVVRASGDSMSPEINAGDSVVVDTRPDQPRRDGIYVLRIDEALLVKRLQWLPDGKLRVISRNPDYEPFTVEPDRVAIVGRVVEVRKRS